MGPVAEVAVTYDHPFVRFMQVVAMLCVIAMAVALFPMDGDDE